MNVQHLVLPLVICLLVYLILIGGTNWLSRPIRRMLILLYVFLHIASWGLMHSIVFIQFRNEIRSLHNDALSNIKRGVIEDEPPCLPVHNSDQKYTNEWIQVNPIPRYNVLSIAPIPFILIANESFQLGIDWKMEETATYVFTGISVEQVMAEWDWKCF